MTNKCLFGEVSGRAMASSMRLLLNISSDMFLRITFNNKWLKTTKSQKQYSHELVEITSFRLEKVLKG